MLPQMLPPWWFAVVNCSLYEASLAGVAIFTEFIIQTEPSDSTVGMAWLILSQKVSKQKPSESIKCLVARLLPPECWGHEVLNVCSSYWNPSVQPSVLKYFCTVQFI